MEVLSRKMMELVSTQPEVATALNAMLDAMLNQASSEDPDDLQAG